MKLFLTIDLELLTMDLSGIYDVYTIIFAKIDQWKDQFPLQLEAQYSNTLRSKKLSSR